MSSLSPFYRFYNIYGRVFLPMGIILLASGAIIYFTRFDLEKYFGFNLRFNLMVSMSLVVYGAAMLLMHYLKGNKSREYESDYLSDEMRILRNDIVHSKLSAEEVKDLKNQIEDLKKQLLQTSAKDALVTEEDKEAIITSVKSSLTNDVSSALVQVTLPLQ